MNRTIRAEVVHTERPSNGPKGPSGMLVTIRCPHCGDTHTFWDSAARHGQRIHRTVPCQQDARSSVGNYATVVYTFGNQLGDRYAAAHVP